MPPTDEMSLEDTKPEKEAARKLADKRHLEELDDEVQKRVNEAVKEVAGKNSELRNKVIELEEKVRKLKEENEGLINQAEAQPSLSQDELLDLLYKSSLNERQTKILQKYKEAMNDFEKQLGTDKFKEALNSFMVEKIEQKVLAMKENKPKK
jgi:hypothetical protein